MEDPTLINNKNNPNLEEDMKILKDTLGSKITSIIEFALGIIIFVLFLFQGSYAYEFASLIVSPLFIFGFMLFFIIWFIGSLILILLKSAKLIGNRFDKLLVKGLFAAVSGFFAFLIANAVTSTFIFGPKADKEFAIIFTGVFLIIHSITKYLMLDGFYAASLNQPRMVKGTNIAEDKRSVDELIKESK